VVRLSGLSGLREIKVSDFVKGAMQTALAEGEILTHVLVPPFSPDARWGHAKYAKKLGDFAQSMAVAVLDAGRGVSRVVLGRRSEPPALMHGVSALLAMNGCDVAADALGSAIDADLHAAEVDVGDRTMHHAIVARAVRDLMA
jgi:aerobic carbon-monoxide dehydrogenase medium subunit